MRTLLISFEGIDACGKTSTLIEVERMLKEKGIKTISINKKSVDRYPTQFLRDYMKKVSSIIWEFTSLDPVGEIPEEVWVHKHALWYTMLNKYIIEPLRKEYEIILIDGWYYKFLARHLSNGEYNFDLTFKIFDSIQACDLAFLFDVNPEECFKRREEFKPSELGEHSKVKGKSEKERFIHYQNEVRNNYLKLAKGQNFKLLDLNNKTSEEVSSLVCNSIIDLIR